MKFDGEVELREIQNEKQSLELVQSKAWQDIDIGTDGNYKKRNYV